MKNDLARQEIERIEWSGFDCSCGDARHIGRELLAFIDPDTPSVMFEFSLEDHVVPNGLLFEAAVPTASVLMAALEGSLNYGPRSRIMHLLWRISVGEPHHEVFARGHGGIDEDCKALMRQGMWHFYSWLAVGDAEIANEILDSVELDSEKLAYYWAIYSDRIPG